MPNEENLMAGLTKAQYLKRSTHARKLAQEAVSLARQKEDPRAERDAKMYLMALMDVDDMLMTGAPTDPIGIWGAVGKIFSTRKG